MNRRTCLAAIACMMVFTFVACDDASTTDVDDTSITGTYAVQSFNGHALPFTDEGEVKVSGSLELKADNTWTVSLVSHLTDGTDTSSSGHGSYTVSNDAITLHNVVDGSNTSGIFTGTTLTLQTEDGVFVLKKN